MYALVGASAAIAAAVGPLDPSTRIVSTSADGYYTFALLPRGHYEIGMTPIFITHDIGLAYYVSDTVYIMERGKFVEMGTADQVILHPKEDYTRRLINDVPKIHEEWDLSTV